VLMGFDLILGPRTAGVVSPQGGMPTPQLTAPSSGQSFGRSSSFSTNSCRSRMECTSAWRS
jgi:hypothetical protein